MHTLLNGDAIEQLRTLPGGSVHCILTSPPYYGLRSYLSEHDPLKKFEIGLRGGSYTADVVAVFRECKRVLRDDGVLWLNIGDVYEDGDLCGIPWIVARCLQSDGWIVRQEIVWDKKSPMPESVSDRCTRSHEMVFMLTKTKRYFYDAEAIKEPSDSSPTGKNRRDVWRLGSTPYKGAHFATMPTTLAELCIEAGTSKIGCCPTCGSPWVRVIEKEKITRPRPNDYVKRDGTEGTGNSCANSVAGVATKTLRWDASCECGKDLAPVPCTVLDPFAGSGTTLAVAESLGRNSIGVELNSEYVELAEKRLAEVKASPKQRRMFA